MSKRVSASAIALPIDSSDLSHLDQPLKTRTRRKVAQSELQSPRHAAPKPVSVLPELPETYAMAVDGDCMVPVILDKQVVIVSKTEEIKRGDAVCLWLKNENDPRGYSALVKKVAMLPPAYVTFPFEEHPESEVVALLFVEQINPPRAYRFQCDQVLALHKVVDVEDRRR